MVTTEIRWSTAELLERAAGAADWLAAQCSQGALHIPVLVPSGADVLALTVAGAALGLPVAPLNPRSGPADLLPLLDPVLTPLVVVDEGPVADLVRSAGCRPVGLPSFPQSSTTLPVPADTDVALVLHTSGTTGVPKRVPGRHRELVARVRLVADVLGLTAASIVTAGSPLHHIAGLGQLLVGLGAGSAVAPLPGGAAGHWSELAALGATHTLLVPTMLHDLLERGALADAPLEVIQYGAAPITAGLVRRVIEALPEVRLIQLYGQTEGSPLTGLDDAAHRAGSGLDTVGVALPGVELRLDGEEVVARAAHLFGAVDGAWLRTGDLGAFDERGRFNWSGAPGTGSCAAARTSTPPRSRPSSPPTQVSGRSPSSAFPTSGSVSGSGPTWSARTSTSTRSGSGPGPEPWASRSPTNGCRSPSFRDHRRARCCGAPCPAEARGTLSNVADVEWPGQQDRHRANPQLTKPATAAAGRRPGRRVRAGGKATSEVFYDNPIIR